MAQLQFHGVSTSESLLQTYIALHYPLHPADSRPCRYPNFRLPAAVKRGLLPHSM